MKTVTQELAQSDMLISDPNGNEKQGFWFPSLNSLCFQILSLWVSSSFFLHSSHQPWAMSGTFLFSSFCALPMLFHPLGMPSPGAPGLAHSVLFKRQKRCPLRAGGPSSLSFAVSLWALCIGWFFASVILRNLCVCLCIWFQAPRGQRFVRVHLCIPAPCTSILWAFNQCYCCVRLKCPCWEGNYDKRGWLGRAKDRGRAEEVMTVFLTSQTKVLFWTERECTTGSRVQGEVRGQAAPETAQPCACLLKSVSGKVPVN